MGEAHDHHVGGGERTAGGAGLLDALEQHLPGAGERAQRDLAGEFGAAAALLGGERIVLDGGGGELEAGDDMGEGGEVLQHHGRVGADVEKVLEALERGGDVATHDLGEEVDDQRAIGEAEHLAHLVGRHRIAGMGDGLVEDGEGVAGGAFRRAGDHGEGGVVDCHLLLGGDVLHQGDQAGGLDAAEVEALAARQYGDRHLAHLGGGEDELHVLRRLLQRLQQAVEGGLRQHVHFVDDVDLVAGDRRLVAHRLDDLADVVDAGVGGGVHLDDVDVAALHDGGAVFAHLVHVDGGLIDLAGDRIVERAGEDARRRGLADAAHAGEHIGLRDTPAVESVGEGAHHRLLADEIDEALRPVLAGKHPIGAGTRLLVSGAVHAPYRVRCGPWRAFSIGGLEWETDGRPAPKLVRAASFRT